MRIANDWNLVVIKRIRSHIRQRIEIQQSLGLRTDLARGNPVARKLQSGGGIEDVDRLAKRIHLVRKISSTFGRVRYETRLRGGVSTPCPLVADKEHWTVFQQMRNFQRPAQCPHPGNPVVSRLRYVLSAQRKGAGVQGRVVEDDSDSAVVQSFRAVAMVAERGELSKR